MDDVVSFFLSFYIVFSFFFANIWYPWCDLLTWGCFVAIALEIKVRELNEKNERLVRAFADMENEVKEIRRRSAMDVQQASKFALSSFAKNLLEVCNV